jgi:dTDP-4-amino-4,6-dideoxygalactose transaminase
MEFIDLKAQYQYLKEEMNQGLAQVLESARFIGGTEVSQLERRLQEYTTRKHCISCGNGTDALLLAYMAIGVKEGDAVFCPDMTFIASIEPACLLGATPIFVDIDIKSYNLDPQSLEERVREIKESGKFNPKAVVAVDFLGNPAELTEIRNICDKYDMYLIEDAAQSMGASYEGKKCCSFGDIACTSFFPSKPLGCYGDGGAVFTDNDEFAELMRSIKVHGKGVSKYDNVRIGINSRLDTLQAAVLLTKLSVLDEEIEKRGKFADIYQNALQDIVKVPQIREGNISSFAQYCVLFHSEEEKDFIAQRMEENGIPSLVYYPNPLHSLEAFDNVRQFHKGDFRNSQEYAQCNLGLPFSPYLKEEDQKAVIETVRTAVEEYRKMH